MLCATTSCPCLTNDIEISQKIGISRIPVREAVIRLSGESRIIEIFPQRGMRISLIDVDFVEEARFMRLVLEKAAVELVCAMAGAQDLKWLEENIRLQEFYMERGSGEKLLELDDEMHKKLFSICRKELTYRMCRRLAIHYDRIRSFSVASVKDYNIISDHRKLLKAIETGDKGLAADTVERHLSRRKINERAFMTHSPHCFK